MRIIDTFINKHNKSFTLNQNGWSHIIKRHSGKLDKAHGTSKFRPEFSNRETIKNLIATTLQGKRILTKYTDGTTNKTRQIFTQTFQKPIGIDKNGKAMNKLKVVAETDGTIVTAFPIKKV